MATPLADQLINRQGVDRLASSIHDVWPRFTGDAFAAAVNGRLMDLKLKERIAWIAQCLTDALPADVPRAVGILVDALPEPCDPTLGDGDFGDFIYAPLSAFVAMNGCREEHLELSLTALREMTMRFSAEDAVRPFIDRFPDRTLARMLEWARDEHYHVRRLASEGSRPLLPWARRLTVPPTFGLPILDVLANDPTRFVTRSVANHLNDIAKLDPVVVVDVLTRWSAESRHDPAELGFITRHATRTLVKRGDPGALALVGARTDLEVRVGRFEVPDRVAIGEDLTMTAVLTAASDGLAIVDYAISFQDARGRMSRRRVFKHRRLDLRKGAPAEFGWRHRFHPDLTTYRVYPGAHRIELIVNGETCAVSDFSLDPPEA